MGIAAGTIAFLRSQGHDALHVRNEGLANANDETIVRKAASERRVILTHDLDFARIVALSGTTVPSVITFRLDRMRPALVNQYVSETLSLFSQALEEGALVSVHESGIRVRSLPVTE